jgi:hypothetical protein
MGFAALKSIRLCPDEQAGKSYFSIKDYLMAIE